MKGEIIKMATEVWGKHNWTDIQFERLERFFRMAQAAEREACAKVCDGWPDYDVQGLAETIRARSEK